MTEAAYREAMHKLGVRIGWIVGIAAGAQLADTLINIL